MYNVANLRNLGNTPSVNGLLLISESKGDEWDLMDLIIFVEYVERFELLFFEDKIIFSICSERTGEK